VEIRLCICSKHLNHIIISLMRVPLYFGYFDSDVYFCIPFRYMLGGKYWLLCSW